MLRVGLTGGIGSGKSTVARLFAELGAAVIDTDQLAREAVLPGSAGLRSVREAFGSAVLTREGQLDRVALREVVFSNQTARAQLEALLHPLIRDLLRQRLAGLAAPYVVIAIPLLVEKGWAVEVDRTLVVDAPEELQIARTAQRDGLSQETIRRIMATQSTRTDRLAVADDVILNVGGLSELEERVRMLHQNYLRLANEAATGKYES